VLREVAIFESGTQRGEAKDTLLDLFDQAWERIVIVTSAIEDAEIVNTLLFAAQRNVMVTVLLDDRDDGAVSPYAQQLANAGMEVLLEQSPFPIRHSFAIIDATVVTGSFLWSDALEDVGYEDVLFLFCAMYDLSEAYIAQVGFPAQQYPFVFLPPE